MRRYLNGRIENCIQRSDRNKLPSQSERLEVQAWLIRWCTVVLTAAFLLPNHYPPWLAFHSELAATLAFAPLIVWAVWQSGPLPMLTVGAFGLALVPIAQFAAGQIFFAGDGWMSSLYLSGFALVVLAGYRTTLAEPVGKPSLASLDVLWVAFVLAGYSSVALALRQWLELGPMDLYGVDVPPGGRAFANLAQPNHLATLLLLAIAAHAVLFETGRLRAGVALPGVLFLASGIVLSGSRSALLALAWLLPTVGLMRRRCSLRTRITAVLGVSFFFVIAMALWPGINEALLLPADVSTALDRLDSPGVRTVYWRSMLDAIGRSPWFGYGWAQIGVAQTVTALDYPATNSYFYNAHNVLLDLLLWNGVPIGLSIILGVTAWFAWQVRQCHDPLSWCALVAIGVVINHAMVEYPLSYTYFLFPVGFLMGALSAAHRTSRNMSRVCMPLQLQRVAVLTAALLTATVFAKVAWEYPFWEQDWRNLRYQEARIGTPERDDLPRFILLTQLDEAMRFSRTEARPGMQALELDWMRRVSARFGHSSGMYRYALALALNNQVAEATLALRRLCHMQSTATCQSAKRSWLELTRDKYPQLKQAPFPATEGIPSLGHPVARSD